MIVKCAVAIAVYLASVLIFYFVANIVCTLADMDAENMIAIYSLAWPITIVFAAFMLVFHLVENASDHVADKLYDIMYEWRKGRKKKEGK